MLNYSISLAFLSHILLSRYLEGALYKCSIITIINIR